MSTAASDTGLALHGGAPVRTAPFAPWPYFDGEQIEAAASVLRSGQVNYWTGDRGRRFEEQFAAAAGCRYAVALANGSVALELALHVLGVGPGDEVIVPSRTFIASATCASLRGAMPVFADVDRDSQNLTAETVRPRITPRTKAIIAVHLAGWPCAMDALVQLARDCGLKVIEDCAQAQGATYQGRPVGSWGDVAAFSFCQDKIMTTGGEGGMLTTNDARLWELAWSYKDHGKSYDTVFRKQHPPGFRWLHESYGTNWRMTEMQSAIGLATLGRIPKWIATRQGFAARLSHAFSRLPALRIAAPGPEVGHCYYKYYVFVRPERLRAGWDRDRISAAVCAEGVPCYSGSCSEIYLEQAFPESLRPSQRLPNAKELGETSLMFLVHPTLADGDIGDTCQAVEKVMTAASI